MPLAKKKKQQPQSTPTPHHPQTITRKTSPPVHTDYDIPEGVQGLLLEEDNISVSSTHNLKLPAEYDEIDDTPEYNNVSLQPNGVTEYDNVNSTGTTEYNMQNGVTLNDSGYDLIEESPKSPTFASPLRSSVANKAKTWAPNTDNYEIPLDAFVGTTSTLPAGNCGDNYETPIDASMEHH